jgi:DNA-binding NtrC family response regulator
MTRVLIVDDEQSVRTALERIVSAMGYEVIAALDGLDAQARLAQGPVDLVITDLGMPGADGFAVLDAVRALRSGLPVIVLTGRGSTQDCVRAMRAGAADFLGKPFDQTELQQVVRAALQSREPSAARDAAHDAPLAVEPRLPQAALVGDSLPMRSVIDQVERVSQSDIAVLLIGERNTGKKATARLLHSMSQRAGKPLVTMRCGGSGRSDPERLDRVLFGTEGASGMLALAEGGTLLLTEMERLESPQRDALVRDLTARISSGAHQDKRADVRILVSVDIEPSNDADTNAFASALQATLDGVMIAMPPLRDRAQDVPQLVEYFTEVANRRLGRRVNASMLTSALQQYPWPGNLVELEERISRYVSEAPHEHHEEVLTLPNAFVVPVDPLAAVVVLSDGTRHDMVFACGPGQPVADILETRDGFVPVKVDGKTRIYARNALACVIVHASESEADGAEDDGLPYKRRAVRVSLRSGVQLDGELRYVAVVGRGRVTDVLNEDALSFSLHAGGAVHHIAKAHVLCIEER